MTANKIFIESAPHLSSDAFGNLPLHVQEQVIFGLLVWIAGSFARIEQKFDRLDTLVDDLEKSVDDLAVGVRSLGRW